MHSVDTYGLVSILFWISLWNTGFNPLANKYVRTNGFPVLFVSFSRLVLTGKQINNEKIHAEHSIVVVFNKALTLWTFSWSCGKKNIPLLQQHLLSILIQLQIPSFYKIHYRVVGILWIRCLFICWSFFGSFRFRYLRHRLHIISIIYSWITKSKMGNIMANGVEYLENKCQLLNRLSGLWFNIIKGSNYFQFVCVKISRMCTIAQLPHINIVWFLVSHHWAKFFVPKVQCHVSIIHNIHLEINLKKW